MKSPFAILLAVVVLVGIGIGVAAIVFIGPITQNDDDGTIPLAAENELPTPSSRTAPVRSQQSEGEVNQSESVVVSTVISSEKVDDDDGANFEELGDNGEVQGFTIEISGSDAEDDQRGFSEGGAPDFQAIQDAIEANPEIQELFQKAQSGNISEEEQVRLNELMEEIFAEYGGEAAGGPGRGFGTPPIQGTISAISGSVLTIEHADDSGLSTDVQVTEETNITVMSLLSASDLVEGVDVVGTVRRGEGGRIFIVDLTVQQDTGRGGGSRGFLGGGLGTGDNPANLSTISGTISDSDGVTVSVETTQGTLRLTANEDSNIIFPAPGFISDITEGMAAIAFGGNQDSEPIQPNNLIVGARSLLQSN